MCKNPIRSVRCPLPESFEEDMNRIKAEREKLIQGISGKCMTANDFARYAQDTSGKTLNKLNNEIK